MFIKPNKKYVIHCRDVDQIEYLWNLEVRPTSKSWILVNQYIEPGIILYGHLVLSLKEVTSSHSITNSDASDHNSITAEKLTTVERNESSFYDSRPLNGKSYRCQICHGIVTNDRCTNCMFDWDS